MTGSTIVFIPSLPKKTANLFERIIEKEEFEHITLDFLTSIDFATITGESKTDFNGANDPVVYDEGGLVIVAISEAGLASVLNFKGTLAGVEADIQADDIAKLQAFVNQFGYAHLYELATF